MYKMATQSMNSNISDQNFNFFSESDLSVYSRAESSYSEQVTDWDEDTLSESLEGKTFLTLDSASNLPESSPQSNLELEPTPSILFEETLLAEPILRHDVTKLIALLTSGEHRRDIVDFQGRTALHIACMLGNKRIVELLLDHGWNCAARTQHLRTPLHEAAIYGHHELISLLSRNTSLALNVADKYGQTAVHLAALHGEVLCLKALLQLECKANLKDFNGRLPTHLAAERGHLNALKILSENGFVLDGKDNKGRLPTHYSAEAGSIQCLRFMNKIGITLVSTDANGWKPIHTAASADQLDCLNYLLAHGSKVYDSDIQGRSVAHVASFYGSVKCLHWILEQGVSPDLKDNKDNSLAHLAAQRGNSTSINCLCLHGGVMVSQNCFGLTPFQTAKNNGNVSNWENGMSGHSSCILCVRKREKIAEAESNRKGSIYTNIEEFSQNLFAFDKVLEEGRWRKESFESSMKRNIVEKHEPRRTKNDVTSDQTWLKQNLAAIYYCKNK